MERRLLKVWKLFFFSVKGKLVSSHLLILPLAKINVWSCSRYPGFMKKQAWRWNSKRQWWWSRRIEKAWILPDICSRHCGLHLSSQWIHPPVKVSTKGERNADQVEGRENDEGQLQYWDPLPSSCKIPRNCRQPEFWKIYAWNGVKWIWEGSRWDWSKGQNNIRHCWYQRRPPYQTKGLWVLATHNSQQNPSPEKSYGLT